MVGNPILKLKYMKISPKYLAQGKINGVCIACTLVVSQVVYPKLKILFVTTINFSLGLKCGLRKHNNANRHHKHLPLLYA